MSIVCNTGGTQRMYSSLGLVPILPVSFFVCLFEYEFPLHFYFSDQISVRNS